MAHSPEGAVDLSDSDIDDLVNEVQGDSTDAATDTADDSTDDSNEVQQDEPDTDDETGEGAQEEEADTEDAQAPPPEGERPPPRATGTERAFTFKGAGQVHALPGAVEQPDGTVRIAREGAEQLRQTLASAAGIQHEWKTQRRHLERENRTLKEGRNDRDIEAEQITTLFQDVREMSPEERWEWANAFDAKAPQLEIQIEKEKLERARAEFERDRRGPELSNEEQRERITETLTGELKSTFQRLMATPEAQSLSQDDKVALWNKWAKKPDRLVSRAEQDMPEAGIQRGEHYFDDQDVVDDFMDRVTVRSQAKGTLTAAQRNDAMNADQRRGNPIPPVARGRQPVSDGKKNTKKLTKKEYEREFMKGHLDDR